MLDRAAGDPRGSRERRASGQPRQAPQRQEAPAMRWSMRIAADRMCRSVRPLLTAPGPYTTRLLRSRIMSDHVTPARETEQVEYRTLGALGYSDGYRVGTDGSVWT